MPGLRPLGRVFVLAFVLAAGFGSAQAADLGYGGPRVSGESPYDDPRYADLYGDDQPPPRRYREPPRYVEPAPYPPRRRFLEPMPGVPRFADRYHDDRRRAEACLPRHIIERRLEAEGWDDFQTVQVGRDVAVIRARRSHGRQFELEIDRCTGEVLAARRIRHWEGPYAWREPRSDWRERRW